MALSLSPIILQHFWVSLFFLGRIRIEIPAPDSSMRHWSIIIWSHCATARGTHLALVPRRQASNKRQRGRQSKKKKQLAEHLVELPPASLKLRHARHPKQALRFSRRKNDTAIDAYSNGCYLCCHDDGIGCRKISHILCRIWKVEQRGALRLYPASARTRKKGKVHKISSPDHEVSTPPIDLLWVEFLPSKRD